MVTSSHVIVIKRDLCGLFALTIIIVKTINVKFTVLFSTFSLQLKLILKVTLDLLNTLLCIIILGKIPIELRGEN